MDEFVFGKKQGVYDGKVPLQPNTRRDFVSNINILAENIHLLREQAPVLGNEGIQTLLVSSKTILKEVIEDVHKGATPQGYRKIDIDLEELMFRNMPALVDKAIITTTDGIEHEYTFDKEVYSLVDVTYQLNLFFKQKQEEGKIVNTICEIIPTTGFFLGMLRVRDSLETYGQFSNVKDIRLHRTKPDDWFMYDWYKTTSSILTLHTSLDSVLDILNRIEKMYAEIITIYADIKDKHEDMKKWYEEILVIYADIKKIYAHILLMYEEIKQWHKEIMEAKDLVLNAVQNATPYIVITEDTEIDIKHIGGMLQCVVPLDTDIITLTVGKDIEWKASMEFMFVPKGKGTVLIKAKGDMVVESQTGTAPLVKGSGKVGCAKLEPDVKTWCVFGALEDI